MRRAVVLYWSQTGNTEKVATSIEHGLKQGGVDTTLRKIQEAQDVDFFDYDLVCFGVPSYSWHPPKPADEYLKAKLSSSAPIRGPTRAYEKPFPPENT
jgi:menaquinone-dependent protoporphyrinogen IX oxidase